MSVLSAEILSSVLVMWWFLRTALASIIKCLFSPLHHSHEDAWVAGCVFHTLKVNIVMAAVLQEYGAIAFNAFISIALPSVQNPGSCKVCVLNRKAGMEMNIPGNAQVPCNLRVCEQPFVKNANSIIRHTTVHLSNVNTIQSLPLCG